MNIESKLWKVQDGLAPHTMTITGKVARISRAFSRGKLPSDDALSAMNEARFNRWCRAVFHDDTEELAVLKQQWPR